MAFNGAGAGTPPPPAPMPQPAPLAPPAAGPGPGRALGVLPALVTANGVAWLLLIPAVLLLMGDGIQVATAQQKLRFFIGAVVVLGGCALVNALFSLALGRALARLEGPRPARAFVSGGLLQFTAVTSGVLAFGRTDEWRDETMARTVIGLAVVWAMYGFGHLQQSRAARHLAPRASVVHAVTGFAGLCWLPLQGLRLDLDDFGAAGIALAVTQGVCALAFPVVIGVVWLRYAVGLRRITRTPAVG